MIKSLSSRVKKIAIDLMATDDSLTQDDVVELNARSPILIKLLKENMDEKKKDPFEGFSEDDKRKLLSFVVYKRQNITTEPTDHPNVEDSAKILHGLLYPTDGTKKENEKSLQRLEEDLKKQLSKAGLEIK